MSQRNPHIAQLPGSYLFVEVARQHASYVQERPEARVISLGIGDTTQPLPRIVAAAMADAARGLGTNEGYRGYQSGYGDPLLRGRIADRLYGSRVSPDEVFVSDGSKPDIGRMQILFPSTSRFMVQNPTYPAYVSSTQIAGKPSVIYAPCTPDNHFFPDWRSLPSVDVLFFCSPNNPTGVVPTRQQLEDLVAFAHESKTLIVFDSAYMGFVSDPDLPRSIFEIDGAEEVALETGSFSKLAGFTGVRLGWTIVPRALKYEDGRRVIDDWMQVQSTCYNGTCSIAQAGGVAALSDEGIKACQELIEGYMDNARLIGGVLRSKGVECYGGEHAPYLWARIPGRDSWGAFHWLLEEAEILCTPGVGFGSAGDGFVRFSAFGSSTVMQEAARRLEALDFAGLPA